MSRVRLPLAACAGSAAVAAALLAWIHRTTQPSPAEMRSTLTLVYPFWIAMAAFAASVLWLVFALVTPGRDR